MGLKAIYCNNDVLEPTMAKPGASASASSDFSGKDIIGYAAVLAAIAALSGCISSTVTETNKPEVQYSASGEGGKPTPDVTTTTTHVAAYDPATFEVPKEHEPLPHNQGDHLFATPGDAVGVSTTPQKGTTDRSDFWVVYEGISKVDGETVKAIRVENGAMTGTIDVPRYVANFDMWEYSTASNKVVGPIHRTLEAGEYYKYDTSWDGFEGRTSVGITLRAIYSGSSNKDQFAICGFIPGSLIDYPNDDKAPECIARDGNTLDSLLNGHISRGIETEKAKTLLKYNSENPQGYAIFSINARP